MDVQHRLKYVIEFIEPVDYFDIVLQKQIDLRLKYTGNTKLIQIVEFGHHYHGFDDRLAKSNFMSKYSNSYNDYNFLRISLLELNNKPEKYEIIKNIYQSCTKYVRYGHHIPDILYDNDGIIVSLEEFEYKMDIMLEEFKLFTNTFEFSEDEKKIINAFVLDEKIKPNIKFAGWRDYWSSV